jgi:hypothetical protein
MTRLIVSYSPGNRNGGFLPYSLKSGRINTGSNTHTP